jgi:hypothetical protein
MTKTTWIGVIGLSLLPLLAACGEEDLTSVRLKLNADHSGTITASSVAVPERAGFEQGMKGATWTDRVGVVAATGSFDSISRLAIGDISFDVEVTDHGMVSMEVVIPLGAAVRWPQLVAPMSPEQRAESARAFDPDGRVKALGSTFKLLIDLPSDVVATGITPHLLGVTASSEGDEAVLLVSVDTALAAHGSLRWHVTWMQ